MNEATDSMLPVVCHAKALCSVLVRKRETMGEQLLKSTELKPGQPTIPVPRPRLMDLAASNK